jgi:hypothetical protein
MKTLFHLITFTALAAGGAFASNIAITFDSSTLTGNPGDTLQFFVNITNSGSANVFLNADTIDLALSSGSYTLNDLTLSNLPVMLGPGESTGDTELFDVTLNNPLADPFGPYSGVYTLQGGATSDAQDNLAQSGFTVDAESLGTPEPATVALFGSGLALIAYLDLRRRLLRNGWIGF